jgi:hypothetical protein
MKTLVGDEVTAEKLLFVGVSVAVMMWSPLTEGFQVQVAVLLG